MSRVIYLFLAVLIPALLSANEGSYNVNLIPKHLMSNANMVIRHSEKTFTISSAEHAVMEHKYAITILNEKANPYAVFYRPYSRGFKKISNVKGVLYDAAGNEVKKLKKSDLRDYSDYDGFSVYSDARVLVATSLGSHTYPYTVEYQYREELTGLLSYHQWVPLYAPNMAVESSVFRVSMPQEMELRYKQLNLEQEVKVEQVPSSKTYQWSITHMPGIEPDNIGPNWSDLVPMVFTGPVNFVYGGYEGDMGSWENFGKWIHRLNSDLGPLPEDVSQRVKQLVADAESKEEATRRVYQYLQETTRYVSIQLGIGGLQPFEPSFVNKNGYGDCKALTYYTKSMLDAAGIKSHYTLVNAGARSRELITDFPSSQFNHVILCVPQETDSLWLECTSQTNPFGFLGTFTGDRNVLLITEEGGQIARTPQYTKNDNQQISVSHIFINELGDAQSEVETVSSGLFYELPGKLSTMRSDDQRKWLYNNLIIPSFQIEDIQYELHKDVIPSVKQSMQLTLRKMASVSGKRMFIDPAANRALWPSSLLRNYSKVPPSQEQRQTVIKQKYDLVTMDTIYYHIPEFLHPEHLPPPVILQSEFGKYQMQIEATPEGLIYTRKLEIDKGTFPAETYRDYRKFIQEIIKADNSKIVLKNST